MGQCGLADHGSSDWREATRVPVRNPNAEREGPRKAKHEARHAMPSPEPCRFAREEMTIISNRHQEK
jgi:hypothetical protein